MNKYFRDIPSILIAIVMIVPIIFVFSNAMNVDQQVWERLFKSRIPTLFINSLLLVVVVTLGAIFFGTLFAFLVEKTNLPFRNIFKPLFIAPLIIPCYIIGICYVNFFGIKGLGEKMFSSLGFDYSLPSIYGFWGAACVLIIGAYPYVYTIVRASINKIDPTFFEAARCLGVSRLTRIGRVALPLLMPAFLASSLLVALYVLSDFGVVSMLRFPTFVSTIYDQMSGRYDYSVATSLSTILILMTIILFITQESIVKRKAYTSTRSKLNGQSRVNLGVYTIPAFILCTITIVAGLILPLGVLIYWFTQSFKVSSELTAWNSSVNELIQSSISSLSVSALVATLAVVLALPLAYWTVRRPESLAGKVFGWMSQSGVALPGVLTALGLSLVFAKISPKLNFSIFALVLAFLVHFFAQSLQMVQAGLRQVSHRLEEGARLLGTSSFKSFWHVTRPLLMPALLTAWILVFLSSMRELPAALLLRPAGFDPLTVRVWISASEGFYEQAAMPALLLVFLSLPLVAIITKVKGSYQASE